MTVSRLSDANVFTPRRRVVLKVLLAQFMLAALLLFAVSFAQGQTDTLTVSIGGGSGTVTSSPSGISCPPTCSALFTDGTQVVLSGAPSTGFVLSGWSNPSYLCNSGGCTFTLTGPSAVSAFFSSLEPQTGIIDTVAGGGLCTGVVDSGDGGPATSACFGPWALAVDSSGNLYFSEESDIRKVTASTGIISTIAGNGKAGFWGDNGPATSAELGSLSYAVALDAAGNIYIADTYNNRIRVVNTGTATITLGGVPIGPGDIRTIVGVNRKGFAGDGGAAREATLNFPEGIAVDAEGNVYISDSGNFCIRVVNMGKQTIVKGGVTIAPNAIETVAGGAGNGRIYNGNQIPALSADLSPGPIAVDGAGNIYVSDQANSRVRVINTGSSSLHIANYFVLPGNIATVAGTGSLPTSGACDGVARAQTVPVGPASGIAIDTAENLLYVPDQGNNCVYAVNLGSNTVTVAGVTIPSGNIATIAGTGAYLYNGDDIPATSANIWSPSAVAVGPAENIYVAHVIRVRVVGK